MLPYRVSILILFHVLDDQRELRFVFWLRIKIQPQPWDVLAVYDDPSYVDETIDAPYMKEVEKKQQ